jgi:hypothetical protein
MFKSTVDLAVQTLLIYKIDEILKTNNWDCYFVKMSKFPIDMHFVYEDIENWNYLDSAAGIKWFDFKNP